MKVILIEGECGILTVGKPPKNSCCYVTFK